jgi:hypothetical protein
VLDQSKSQEIEPFIINQIAQSLFGDRFIIIYDNTIQFHNHCYHVEKIEDAAHPYQGHYYLLDANTHLAMQTDVDFAPQESYGAIFNPTTGEIVGYDSPKAE